MFNGTTFHLAPFLRYGELFAKNSLAYLQHGLDLANDLFGRYDRVFRVASISSRDVTDDVSRRPQGGVELGVRVNYRVIVI